MHERDRNRSLTHTRCYTLDGAVPNVTHDKDARNICFQKSWLTIQLPAVWPLAVMRKLWAGIDKAPLITFDNVRQPVRVRRCSDHDEQRVGGNCIHLAGGRAVNGNGLEMFVTVRLNNR